MSGKQKHTPYEFTVDWFSNNAQYWKQLFEGYKDAVQSGPWRMCYLTKDHPSRVLTNGKTHLYTNDSGEISTGTSSLMEKSKASGPPHELH